MELDSSRRVELDDYVDVGAAIASIESGLASSFLYMSDPLTNMVLPSSYPKSAGPLQHRSACLQAEFEV